VPAPDRGLQEWPRVLEEAKAASASLAAFLKAARPVDLAGDSVTLAFPPSMAFHRARCEEDEGRRVLERVLASVYGRRVRVRFETAAEEPAPAAPPDGNGVGNGTAGGTGPPGVSGLAGAEEFDRLRSEEIEALQQAPAVKALEKEFQVRRVRVGRRRSEEKARGDAGGETTEERA
jgi:hypothetical protein